MGCVRSTAPSGADPRCAAIEGEIPPQNLATFANPKTLVAVETETWWQTSGSLHWELADQNGTLQNCRFSLSPSYLASLTCASTPVLAGDASKGDPIESCEILLVDGPTECPGVLFSLVPVLGPGDRNHTLCHDPVQGDLTRHLPPVLVTDAPQLGDDSVDNLHGMFGEVAFAEGRMRRRVLARESTLADR